MSPSRLRDLADSTEQTFAKQISLLDLFRFQTAQDQVVSIAQDWMDPAELRPR